METETFDIEAICQRVLTGEFQDEENPELAAQRFGSAICRSLQQPNDATVLLCQRALIRALAFSEYKPFSFCSQSPVDSTALACGRAQIVDSPEELPVLMGLIVRSYSANPSKYIPLLLAALLSQLESSPTLLKLILNSLRLIINKESASSLLTAKLLPLHGIQGKISPTQSRLESFHRELTLCVFQCCALQPSMFDVCLQELASTLYPSMKEGNSPKEVLFLHEMDTLLQQCAAGGFSISAKTRACVCTRLLSCISAPHGMVCERALTFWKSDTVFALLQGDDFLLSKFCDTALSKAILEHWSPTVRTMAGAALFTGKPVHTLEQESSSPLIRQAVQHVKQSQLLAQHAKPLEPMPLPKSFSSTSVIRDAMEPFASGAFGVLWRGRAIVAGVSKAQWPLVALKEIDSEATAAARWEMEAMTRIGFHPNLVQLLGMFETSRPVLHLVLELVDGPGDLHTVVVERNWLDVPTTRHFAAQLGSALRFVHGRNFVFGDVKPENCLISPVGVLKLCDFGACFMDNGGVQSKPLQGGTVEYFPPEQVSSKAGDWWAFGCVIHFMLTGKPPVFFDHESESDLPQAFARAVTFADQQGGSLIQDNTARQLVAQLCARDANNRPLDGGESHTFFNPVRPWDMEHSRTCPLAPAIRSKNAAPSGPWQRRTFSTIHSPLPKEYVVLDQEFARSCLVMPPQVWSLSVDFAKEDALSLVNLFFQAQAKIPRTRMGRTAAAVCEVKPGDASKTRRQNRPNYNVGGLDLTAG